MWKAGIAIFSTLWTFLCLPEFLSPPGKEKIVSDLNLEFSCSSRECFEEIFVCSQFPLKPVHNNSCSVCRNPNRMAPAGNSPCAWGMFFLSTPGVECSSPTWAMFLLCTPGATGWGRGCPIPTQSRAEFSLLEKRCALKPKASAHSWPESRYKWNQKPGEGGSISHCV